MARVAFIIQREKLDTTRSVQKKVLFPIEPAFSAALLKNNGHIISAFDLNLIENEDKIETRYIEFLQSFKPDHIVSAPQMLTFLIKENYDDTAKLFDITKDYNKNIKTVYTGAFATSYQKEAIKRTKADFLIKGEFDIPLLKIVNNEKYPDTNTFFTEDLDMLPFPCYEEFNYKEYFKYPGRANLRYPEYSRNYTHYQTSRGCTCLCSFCNVSFLRGIRKQRIRTLPLVIKDLCMLVKDYGIEEIHFLDENLNLNKSRIKELCKGVLDSGLNFKWIAAGGMSIYSLDEETLKLMYTAGCYRLNLAFESGSQEVIDNIIKKPVKLNRDIEKLQIAKDIGFEIIGYFVIGFPDETQKQIEETIALASNPLFDYVTISIATPQRGTELEKKCLEKGLLNKDDLLADVSRRSTALYKTVEFTQYDIEKIRCVEWDRINFSFLKRKEKIAKMMGVTTIELDRIRKETEENFKTRWKINT
ncbi:MAG: radical SAM protein [Candidatus Hydrogenedentota bacterium]